MTGFDPNAAAQPGSGVFGLPDDERSAGVILLQVPFDATTSYRRGAADGPAAIVEASRQVDLFDRELGRPYEAGIFACEPDPRIGEWNARARALADPILAAGGAGDDAALLGALAEVNALSERLDALVEEEVEGWLSRGKLVGVVGGDHATPLGAIAAHARRHPGLGVLHVDAHADLRDAYEGFTRSHASIMFNVLARCPDVARIVQVGVRDFGEGELEVQRRAGDRVRCFFDADLARAKLEGASWASLTAPIVAALPGQVYVSFDIDGLDPSLCPSTGTPVPGGLSFHEACYLLSAVARSGRRIVGFDLNEVAPGEGEWDANVGARLLYKMIGCALLSRGA
ncbi:MAG: agmatinase family protein [Polyangiaceae bacterium]|nr:agmatinase family protein [Polyangiaceae bacterium]